jgi:hypothetical protein
MMANFFVFLFASARVIVLFQEPEHVFILEIPFFFSFTIQTLLIKSIQFYNPTSSCWMWLVPDPVSFYTNLHVLCVYTDTENIKLIFCAVKDTIMHNTLQEFNLAWKQKQNYKICLSHVNVCKTKLFFSPIIFSLFFFFLCFFCTFKLLCHIIRVFIDVNLVLLQHFFH